METLTKIGRFVFGVPLFNVADCSIIAISATLIFNGHWLIWIPLALVGLVGSRYAESYFGG